MTSGKLPDCDTILQGLGFGLTLSWLFAVPFCPAQIAAALPHAPLFLGAFVLGCALACTSTLVAGHRHGPRPAAALLLPLGAVAEVLAATFGLPYSRLWVALLGLVMGLGEGAGLLAWCQRFVGRPAPQAIGVFGSACLVVGALTAVLGALPSNPAALRGFLVVLSASTALAVFVQPCCTASGTLRRETIARPPTLKSVRTYASRIWEPVLGLGIGLMSAILPWGSLLTGNDASVPSYWTFAAGMLLTGTVVLLGRRLVAGKVDFDVVVHIAVPLLATMVVGLRMVGDLEETNQTIAVLRGVGSGAAGAGFLACALAVMAREARRQDPIDQSAPFALGFGAACLVGFAILPVHAASQQAAALMAPFLSLAFLAVSCCSSAIHIRRHVETRQAPAASMGIEEAAQVLARRYDLSPRETQVLSQLVVGRSAASIGKVLGISPNTVRSHVGSIHGKLSIQSRDQLVDLIEQTRDSLTKCHTGSNVN